MDKRWWREHYERNARQLKDVARSYRGVAGKLVDSDPEFATFAFSRATQNEQWAKEDEERAVRLA